MKVCAHINYGPYQNAHARFGSALEAKDHFRREVVDSPYGHGPTEGSDGCYVMDLYPQCAECDSAMNFHDYPLVRYVVGPRGGLQRVSV